MGGATVAAISCVAVLLLLVSWVEGEEDLASDDVLKAVTLLQEASGPRKLTVTVKKESEDEELEDSLIKDVFEDFTNIKNNGDEGGRLQRKQPSVPSKSVDVGDDSSSDSIPTEKLVGADSRNHRSPQTPQSFSQRAGVAAPEEELVSTTFKEGQRGRARVVTIKRLVQELEGREEVEDDYDLADFDHEDVHSLGSWGKRLSPSRARKDSLKLQGEETEPLKGRSTSKPKAQSPSALAALPSTVASKPPGAPRIPGAVMPSSPQFTSSPRFNPPSQRGTNNRMRSGTTARPRITPASRTRVTRPTPSRATGIKPRVTSTDDPVQDLAGEEDDALNVLAKDHSEDTDYDDESLSSNAARPLTALLRPRPTSQNFPRPNQPRFISPGSTNSLRPTPVNFSFAAPAPFSPSLASLPEESEGSEPPSSKPPPGSSFSTFSFNRLPTTENDPTTTTFPRPATSRFNTPSVTPAFFPGSSPFPPSTPFPFTFPGVPPFASLIPGLFDSSGFNPSDPLQFTTATPSQPPVFTPSLPSQFSTAAPSFFTTPGPFQFSSPGPSQFTTPGPFQFSSPTPSQFTIPDLSQFTTPGPSQFTTPGPFQFTSPSPLQFSFPDPFQFSTPAPFPLSSPGLFPFSSPGPSQFTSPGPFQFTIPNPSQFSTPNPSQFSTPNPSQFSTPGSSQFSTPGSSQFTTPSPSLSTSPSTPQFASAQFPFNSQTPFESVRVTTPHSLSVPSAAPPPRPSSFRSQGRPGQPFTNNITPQPPSFDTLRSGISFTNSPRHGATFTNSPRPGTSFTNSPRPGTSFTNSPRPGTSFTNSPRPGTSFTNTHGPGTSFTNSPRPGASFTNSPRPGASFTNSPRPETSFTNTLGPGTSFTNSLGPGTSFTNSLGPGTSFTNSLRLGSPRQSDDDEPDESHGIHSQRGHFQPDQTRVQSNNVVFNSPGQVFSTSRPSQFSPSLFPPTFSSLPTLSRFSPSQGGVSPPPSGFGVPRHSSATPSFSTTPTPSRIAFTLPTTFDFRRLPSSTTPFPSLSASVTPNPSFQSHSSRSPLHVSSSRPFTINNNNNNQIFGAGDQHNSLTFESRPTTFSPHQVTSSNNFPFRSSQNNPNSDFSRPGETSQSHLPPTTRAPFFRLFSGNRPTRTPDTAHQDSHPPSSTLTPVTPSRPPFINSFHDFRVPGLATPLPLSAQPHHNVIHNTFQGSQISSTPKTLDSARSPQPTTFQNSFTRGTPTPTQPTRSTFFSNVRRSPTPSSPQPQGTTPLSPFFAAFGSSQSRQAGGETRPDTTDRASPAVGLRAGLPSLPFTPSPQRRQPIQATTTPRPNTTPAPDILKFVSTTPPPATTLRGSLFSLAFTPSASPVSKSLSSARPVSKQFPAVTVLPNIVTSIPLNTPKSITRQLSTLGNDINYSSTLRPFTSQRVLMTRSPAILSPEPTRVLSTTSQQQVNSVRGTRQPSLQQLLSVTSLPKQLLQPVTSPRPPTSPSSRNTPPNTSPAAHINNSETNSRTFLPVAPNNGKSFIFVRNGNNEYRVMWK